MAWLSGWSRRKKLTVDHNQVDAALIDFPVYVHVNADTDIGAGARSDGYDLRFTQSDGTTLLKYEVDYFNIGGGSCTAHVWVKVPSVSAVADTEFYLYYGKADASDGEDAANVWDASFVGVWHLNEASGHPQDSSGNGHHADAEVISTYQATGAAGYGVELDGTNDYIEVPDHAAFELSAMTVEAWALPDVTDANRMLIQQFAGGTLDALTLKQNPTASGVWEFRISEGATHAWALSDSAPSGSMQHLAGIRDSSGNMRLYVDGALQADTDVLSSTVQSTSDLHFGCRASDHDLKYGGILD